MNHDHRQPPRLEAPPASPAGRDASRSSTRFFGDADADASSVVTSQWVPRVDIRRKPSAS